MATPKIAAFCIFRDSEKSLDTLFSQLEGIEKKYDLSYFFYENDSVDCTVDRLNNFLSNRNGKLKSEKLGAPKFGSVTNPERMSLLCSCRNKCKLLADGEYDCALIFDSDIKFSVDNLDRHWERMRDSSIVMSTPNIRQNIPDYTDYYSGDSYYDIYPFKDFYGNNGLYFSDCPSMRYSDIEEWRSGNIIDVNSAFGGFALVDWNGSEKL